MNSSISLLKCNVIRLVVAFIDGKDSVLNQMVRCPIDEGEAYEVSERNIGYGKCHTIVLCFVANNKENEFLRVH